MGTTSPMDNGVSECGGCDHHARRFGTTLVNICRNRLLVYFLITFSLIAGVQQHDNYQRSKMKAAEHRVDIVFARINYHQCVEANLIKAQANARIDILKVAETEAASQSPRVRKSIKDLTRKIRPIPLTDCSELSVVKP